jgi:hypothetical protein
VQSDLGSPEGADNQNTRWGRVAKDKALSRLFLNEAESLFFTFF